MYNGERRIFDDLNRGTLVTVTPLSGLLCSQLSILSFYVIRSFFAKVLPPIRISTYFFFNRPLLYNHDKVEWKRMEDHFFSFFFSSEKDPLLNISFQEISCAKIFRILIFLTFWWFLSCLNPLVLEVDITMRMQNVNAKKKVTINENNNF